MGWSKTEQDYHEAARAIGLEWIGKEIPPTVMDKTLWRCAAGHEFMAKYNHVQQGHGCRECYGNAPKTKEDFIALAEKMGVEWLGTESPGVNRPTRWRCNCGNEWMARYGDVAKGRKCKECGIQKRATAKRVKPDKYHEIAKARGFEWLGPEVKDTSTNTEWRCSENHRWFTSFNHIRGGRNCPKCSKKNVAAQLRHPPGDYHRLAESRGFKWLGPEVGTGKQKTWWECSKGHKWENGYNNISSGNGCPTCSQKETRRPEHYHELAEKRGFKWPGPEVSDVKQKTWWECPVGHKVDTTFDSLRGSRGCRKCTGKERKTPDDYRTLAESRSFNWLGPEVTRTNKKTTWQCSNLHKWPATYNEIQRGRGCSVCIQSRGEARITELLTKWGIPFDPQKRFKGCRDKHTLPFDFYFEVNGIRFLCEYQGRQHVEAVSVWGGEGELEKVQRRDAIKAQFAKDHNFVLIVISHLDFDRIKTILADFIEGYTGVDPYLIRPASQEIKGYTGLIRGKQIALFE